MQWKRKNSQKIENICENFWLLFFDGFTHFGCPEYNFTIYKKCLCDTNFVVQFNYIEESFVLATLY